MSRHNLFNIIGDVNSSNVNCSVLPHETSYTTHIISVVGELVASEAIDVGVEMIVCSGESMKKIAVLTLWANSTRKAQAEEAPGGDLSGIAPAISLVDGEVRGLEDKRVFIRVLEGLVIEGEIDAGVATVEGFGGLSCR